MPPPPQSSAFFFSLYRYPFRPPSDCAPSRVIGRGRAFHLYGPVCVDRCASFSCIKARCIFRVSRLPQPPPPHSLSRLSIPSSATDPPTSPLHHPEPLDVPVSNRDARCSLCSQRRRTTDSCVRFSGGNTGGT